MAKDWFGHPRGLATLFFTEMWERFSHNGLRALLMLYMVGSIQQPGLGFGERRAATIYGLYTMLVYLSGIPGGWLADRFLGRYHAVLYGGIIIALGHFSMAVPGLPFFYLGLGLIVIGTGLLKPNVSSMVGSLYSPEDTRRDAGYSIFYMGINLGAFIAPLLCGWLAQKYDWHLGFGLAGVGMLAGLVQYVMGKKHLRDMTQETRDSSGTREPNAAPLSRGDWSRIGALMLLTFFALLFWAGFGQAGTSLTLFADRATRLTLLGFEFPSSWFQAVEPLFIILFAPLFAWLWLRLGRHEPSSPVKFTLGLVFLSLSFVLIIPAARMFETSGQRVSALWLIGLYFLQMVGELCLSPVGLSLVARLSPARITGLMMGVWLAATAMGNYVAAWLAGFLEDRTFSYVFTAAFFGMAVAALLLAVLVRPIKRLMARA
ncbi:MAG TPA: peptide MFS transporter [Thermoanaerobaculia bacterium]